MQSIKEKTADEMEDRKNKIQILADRIMSILPLIDGFMEDEDFELLKEVKESLQDKINYGNSASVLIMALGGNYDDTEDRMKIKTLDCLIELVKTRREYREELLEKQKQQANRQEAINLFKAMGMF